MDIVNSNTRSKWLNDAFINFYMALWSQHAALRAQVRGGEAASAIFVQTYFHETLGASRLFYKIQIQLYTTRASLFLS